MKSRSSLFLFILLMAGVLSACQSKSEIPPGSQQTPGITVDISNEVCPGVSVAPGNQVTWVNRDDQEHILQIEGPGGETVLDAGVLQPNDSVSFTFPQAGSYTYYCSSDRGYTGTITVEP